LDHNNRPNFWPSGLRESPLDGEAGLIAPFNPSEFFIPGWKGEGLITASAIVIKNTLNNLTIDAEALFKKSCSTSKSIKLQTYNEFMQYAEYSKLDKTLLAQQNDFWLHVQDESSPLKKSIDNFFKIHCFRAVAIYLFRIKFIMDLAKEQRLGVTEDVLLNPLSFLGRIFVKDSSTELLCDSLQINQYSWYRPTLEYKDSLLKLKEAFENITLTELIKIISTTKDDQIYSIKNYSHALSHLSFGLLVNELLIKFPTWLKPDSKIKSFSQQKLCLLPKTINTRFAGNHVSSLALSHWLAQESNIKVSQWSNLICPQFDGAQFIDGEFLKICQELQFLSFLTRIAIEHKYEVIPFICKIMREKYKQSSDEGQASFFNLGAVAASETLYSRIVLNLTELPKTNPHHFLVQQILSQKPLLKKDAMIFVFTNQKLFVPSHSERVEVLLKDFKVEACFNMEDLKGKGEIAHFAYVLTKRNTDQIKNKHLFEVNRKLKESCLSFELKGNLTRFNKFNKLVEELQLFIKTKNPITTPLYVNEVDKDIFFEFHQDAIIDGKLVSSTTSKDTTHLPHPSFFKNLTRTSAPLDTFFNIEHISHEDLHQNKQNISSELLGLKFGPEKQYPLLLIINQNDPMDVKIELSPIEAYRGKLEQYGTAFYHYFGLTPKHSCINLNVFREYFSSMLGHQIIQLQLSDGPTKLKAKLRSLLIPSFFTRTQFMPESMKGHYNLLDMNEAELKNIHPDEILGQFNALKTHFSQHSKEFPWHILSLLSHFKLQIKSLAEELEDAKPQNLNFGNSLISNALIQLKTQAIYPKNPDVFVDYKIKNHQELQLPLTSLVVKNTEEESVLIFKFHEKEIIHFYSSPIMNHFIKFVLQNATGVKIADILLNLKVPTLKDLESTTKHFEQLRESKTLLLKSTEELIAQILRTEISREN
jgi:hypothetical protein